MHFVGYVEKAQSLTDERLAVLCNTLDLNDIEYIFDIFDYEHAFAHLENVFVCGKDRNYFKSRLSTTGQDANE